MANSDAYAPSSYIENAIDFLKPLWEGKPGYGFIGTKGKGDGYWRDHPVNCRNFAQEVQAILKKYPRMNNDTYFSANRFSKPVRQKAFALGTSLGWCDIDDADPSSFVPRPSVLIQTSPGRHQGLWFWNHAYTPEEAEAYSKALAYNHGADRNGWTVTKHLRLPFTYNHKPHYDRPSVKLLRMDTKPITARPKPLQPKTSRRVSGRKVHVETKEIEFDLKLSIDKIISKYARKLGPKVKYLLRTKRVEEPDRSKQIYIVVASLHEAGATEEEIAYCLWHNSYFIDKHGQNWERVEQEIARVTAKLT